MAEKRMVKYRDANTESKYGEGYGDEYSSMGYDDQEYLATSDSGFSF